MKLFKAKIADYKLYEISKENFESQTRRCAPHYKHEKGKTMHYAVCPACENPIQIIGLYTPAKHTEKPFGKHVKKTIRNLASYNQQAYDFCPYASHKSELSKSQKKEKLGDTERRILTQLIEYFDQVAYILEKETGIRLSEKLATSMLKKYKAEQGYLYYGANLQNVPWMFAYMADNQTLWGRKVTDLELTEKICSSRPNLYINEYGLLRSKPETFSDINFWFTKHRVALDADRNLIESITLVVTESKDDIATKTIHFDHSFFQSLLHVSDQKRPRKDELVPLAENILGSLL